MSSSTATQDSSANIAVAAANPPTGCSLVIFEPIVWMMRQPPDSVPSAIAACAESTTHMSIRNSLM